MSLSEVSNCQPVNTPFFVIFKFFKKFLLIYFGFLRQGFSVVLEPVLELTLGLELTEICLPLHSECWN